MTGHRIDPCPECSRPVDHVNVSRASDEAEAVAIAHPCGHRVAPVVWPDRLELQLYVEPDAPAPAPDDLAGLADAPSAEQLAADLRHLAGTHLLGLPWLPPLAMMAPLLDALTRAMADARVLGTGWIRLQAATPGGMPVLERVDPALIIVREPSR